MGLRQRARVELRYNSIQEDTYVGLRTLLTYLVNISGALAREARLRSTMGK